MKNPENKAGSHRKHRGGNKRPKAVRKGFGVRI